MSRLLLVVVRIKNKCKARETRSTDLPSHSFVRLWMTPCGDSDRCVMQVFLNVEGNSRLKGCRYIRGLRRVKGCRYIRGR